MAKYTAPNTPADEFLCNLDHPFKDVIDSLRSIILKANVNLREGIKWNAPSYSFAGEDRITFNLRAKDEVRLIFHCGAKVKDGRGKGRLIDDTSGLLRWASDDRAIASFSSLAQVKKCKVALTKSINAWLDAASGPKEQPR